MECYFTSHKIADTLILDIDDSKHLVKVLRHKIDDKIIVIYEQQKYLTKIIAIEANVKCQIIEILINGNYELSCKITLVMALLKEQKFDLVIQKAVELGVHQIVPLQLKRCISVVSAQKAQQKVLRWQNIAKAAAKQANRNLIPLVTPVIFNLNQLSSYKSDLNLVAYENATNTTWTNKLSCKLASVTILVGPEGGIIETEITTLKTLGFTDISLGKLILRAETAPLFLLSIFNYETNLKLKGAEND